MVLVQLFLALQQLVLANALCGVLQYFDVVLLSFQLVSHLLKKSFVLSGALLPFLILKKFGQVFYLAL